MYPRVVYSKLWARTVQHTKKELQKHLGWGGLRQSSQGEQYIVLKLFKKVVALCGSFYWRLNSARKRKKRLHGRAKGPEI